MDAKWARSPVENEGGFFHKKLQIGSIVLYGLPANLKIFMMEERRTREDFGFPDATNQSTCSTARSNADKALHTSPFISLSPYPFDARHHYNSK